MVKEQEVDFVESRGEKYSPPVKETQEAKADFEYFKEARLFIGKDRVTLTFYHENEVASIHFDMGRGEIFYRGHNIHNLHLTKEQWTALERFGDFLSREADDKSLSNAYRQCLEQAMLPKWSYEESST